jgi:hypothetical protein
MHPGTTEAYGYDGELHGAWFEPPRWGGDRPIVGLEIPECKMHFTRLVDGQPSACFAVHASGKPELAIESAAKLAVENQAWFALHCDTHAEAENSAAAALEHLKGYKRVALERMYEAQNRERQGLS